MDGQLVGRDHPRLEGAVNIVAKTYDMVNDPEFKDYEDFRNRYPITTFRASPAYVSYNMYCFFFERVGILLHRKLIDIELVDDLFSLLIKYDWEKAKPIVEGIRKEFNMPQYWEYFEYLYNEMKKRQQQLEQKGVKNG